MPTIIKTLALISILAQVTFAQWNQQTSGSTSNLNSIYFINNSTGWIAGTNGTILKTTNGGNQWISQSSGTTSNLTSIYFTDENNGWSTGENLLVLKTTNGGTNWISHTIPGNVHNLEAMSFANSSTGWVIGNYQFSPGLFDVYIYKTTNGGSSWYFLEGVMDEKMYSIYFLNSNLGWIAGTTVLITTDGGSSWNYPIEDLLDPNLRSIFFIDAEKGWITGTTFDGIGIIFRTVNGGLTWTTVYTDPSRTLNSIFFRDQNTGWCTGSGGTILYTTDGGTSWTIQPTGTNQFISSICFPLDEKGWAAGSNGTIFYTMNSGTPVELTSFTAEASGMNIILNWSTATELNNSGFEIQKSVDKINFMKIGFIKGYGTVTDAKNYSFTDKPGKSGKYYYRLKQVDFDGSYEYSEIIEAEAGISREYLLEQNYPNPFNPSTSINYYIPEQGIVSLIIYNVLGKETAVLVQEEKQEGYYNAVFDASDLSAGVYYYQLKAGSFISTKKMLLIK